MREKLGGCFSGNLEAVCVRSFETVDVRKLGGCLCDKSFGKAGLPRDPNGGVLSIETC